MLWTLRLFLPSPATCLSSALLLSWLMNWAMACCCLAGSAVAASLPGPMADGGCCLLSRGALQDFSEAFQGVSGLPLAVTFQGSEENSRQRSGEEVPIEPHGHSSPCSCQEAGRLSHAEERVAEQVASPRAIHGPDLEFLRQPLWWQPGEEPVTAGLKLTRDRQATAGPPVSLLTRQCRWRV